VKFRIQYLLFNYLIMLFSMY